MPAIILRRYLRVNSVPLATPAFYTVSLRPLRRREKRGDDQLLPGAAGVIGRPRRRTVVRMSFPMVIDGAFDLDGNLRADPWAGLDANTDHLMANVVDAVGGADGTVLAELVDNGVVIKSAPVHVVGLGPAVSLGPTADRTVLDLSVPAGRFT